ncbi:CDP-6-deoxy-delta-3,4-glucoseen reductase [Usitatibacter palustris]|uniref:CDP-6-deoxy-L-threo-D-glycero-4-hexulose-3-dehydrase reductase n=1 Tax=Usitatibacter palustris TaxID=2732487 RepID=A0A6M4HB35_9PROT|nr:CDP-6-deoxy-delta-3,4-glucoseen reductase [Usitatibacter palustris]QJR16900.1 CDP-6-deoxy-L-threo-D-glycero-4-hexulose-3-dehydrase reductase [Usitatibacter palustris]
MAESHEVRLEPSGHTFSVNSGETVLEAALRQGIGLPYGCRNGACGACKSTLVSGELQYGDYQERALHDSEKAAGKALTCCTKPLTDVTLQVRELAGAKDLQIRTLPARIERVEKPAEDVAVLYLKLPASERLQFLAGQYIDILLKDGKRRSFSMANAPHDDALLQLHVRKAPGGAFSKFVFEEMKERAIIRFEGPLGTFYLREDSDKPVIFVAGGTGFAPIKSLIEHAFQKDMDRQMVLYWGARARSDLYLPEVPAKWAAEHPNFSYVPVLSDPLPGDEWSGRTGFVHQAVLDDFPSLAGFQVYACGAPAMTDIAKATFVEQKGLPEDEFFCDAFTYSVDPKK